MHVVSGKFFARGTHTNCFLITLQGSGNREWQVIVRLPLEDTRRQEEELHKEHGVLRYLEQEGIKFTPRSLFYDSTREHVSLPYSVQSYLECERMKRIPGANIDGLASSVSRLHQVGTISLAKRGFPTYGTYYAFIVAEIDRLADWISRLDTTFPTVNLLSEMIPILVEACSRINTRVERERVALARPDSLFTLMHGDLGSHNMGQTPGGVVLFDWQSSAIGDPAFDIAKLFHNDLRAEDQRRTFIAAYWRQELGASVQNFIERASLYELIAATQTSVWAIQMICSRANPTELAADDQLAKQIAHIGDTLYRSISKVGADLANTVAKLLTNWGDVHSPSIDGDTRMR